MSSIVFNVAKGRVSQLARNVVANSPAGCCLTLVVLKASGLEADATLQDYDDLAAILAAANDEATNSGYARKELVAADITVTVDDSGNLQKVILTDQTWAAVAAAGGAWGALLVCYDPTGSSADSAIIPLTKSSFAVTPDTNDIVADVSATDGVFSAA